MSAPDRTADTGDALWGAELPLRQLPDVPHWLENYAWDAYDPTSRIGLYLHVGRWYRDPTLWRELVLVCFDGREVYCRRNIGRVDEPRTVGASSLRLICEKPMQRWRWRYHGPALLGTASTMMHRPPLDDEARLLDFELLWSAAGPVVDFGHGTEPGAASSHYEQGGTLQGHITVDGQSHAFDGRTFRDHSRGPRTLENHFNRHTWIHGTFPSRRTISSLIVEMPDGKLALSDLFAVGADGRLEKYSFKPALLWDTWDGMERPYSLVGVNDRGGRLQIDARPQFSYPVTLGPPMDLFVGQCNEYPGWRVFQMPTQLTWDGETTFGHTEFSLSAAASKHYPGSKEG